MRLCAALAFFSLGAFGADTCVLPAGTFLRVALAPGSPTSLKSKAVLSGDIRQPVYHGTCKVLPAGVLVKATPAGEGVSVELASPGMSPMTVPATVVRFAKEKEAVAAGKPQRTVRTLLLRVKEPLETANGIESSTIAEGTIPAGTRVRVVLDSDVYSKRSPSGAGITARLLEPIFLDGKVLVPEGTSVHGTVAGVRRARRLYRAGSLRLAFHSLQHLPRRDVNVSLSVTAGQLTGGARIDQEGTITGSALTKKRALINAGISYATGKILDDVIEEGAKAVYGVAAAGSAEVAARYVSLAAGAAMFLLHKGREVKLDSGTQLSLTFARPVAITK